MQEKIKQLFKKQNGLTWRPIFTLGRNEKKVYELLRNRGYEAYLPMRTHINIQPVISKGKNYCYKRKLIVPMFSNYVFACLSYDNCSELLRDRSIIRILPVTSKEEEVLINELKIIQVLESFSENEEIDVSNGLQKGLKVRFTDGDFKDWEGIILTDVEDNGFVYINVTSISACIKLKYPAVWCKVIKE